MNTEVVSARWCTSPLHDKCVWHPQWSSPNICTITALASM